jgi:hypothetical protein
VVGNRIAVAWISRYCDKGAPLYSWTDDEKASLLTAYSELDHLVTVDGVAEPYQLYSDDLFGVAGSQDSVNYTLQGFPEVGEIPYGCVWVARGTLEPVTCDELGVCDYAPGDTTGLYDIVWRQAERLTSGRRDANRVEISGAPGAGFVISWQEDPEGLRPGKGLGPGEGWSGAIANSKTDIWYTYISWDHFDDVCTDEPADDTYCTPGELPVFAGTDLETEPKVAVPFAVPVRLTDNNMCKSTQKLDSAGELINPYCYADFNENSSADLCAESVKWTNPSEIEIPVCKTEDGRVLNGGTASTRVRWEIKPYTKADGTGSAWVLMGEEKMKALGDIIIDDEEIADIGKNMWYHTFEFNNPELVQQGLMLNSPALDPNSVPDENGDFSFFPVFQDEFENEYYETEIARRFNLMTQGYVDADLSESRTTAVLIYKEGILNQGGPADIFIRRVVLPDTFDPAVDNPFAYENVVCDAFGETADPWLYADGSNPNYVRGLCTVQGMNVSGTTIVACDDGTSGETCAASFPWDADAETNSYPKVTEWSQTIDNFDDPSWANPYDVSKGHRGFMDGDFVQMEYATAPNWKANTTGNEAYNLYVRRSFDGGQTWTTMPASWTHIDGATYTGAGITTCEDYGWGGTLEYEVCTYYGPGEFEQAHNVSRLTGSKITVLDPRYIPTGGMLKTSYKSLLCFDDTVGDWVSCEYESDPYIPLETRDPSVYFITYETGDNTVVDEFSAAIPLDMYYSRATNFGEYYDEINICDDPDSYPNASEAEKCSETNPEIYRWDWLENGDELATEASLTSSPAGDRFYAVWNSELEIAYEVYTDMDQLFRRIFYNVIEEEVATAAIVLVSNTKPFVDEDLMLVGDAWDNDPYGSLPSIVEHEWSHTFAGVTTVVDDGDGDPLTLQMAAGSLDPGNHTFSFRAKDNEGNWSATVSVDIQVRPRFHIFFPIWFLP